MTVRLPFYFSVTGISFFIKVNFSPNKRVEGIYHNILQLSYNGNRNSKKKQHHKKIISEP